MDGTMRAGARTLLYLRHTRFQQKLLTKIACELAAPYATRVAAYAPAIQREVHERHVGAAHDALMWLADAGVWDLWTLARRVARDDVAATIEDWQGEIARNVPDELVEALARACVALCPRVDV